MSAISVQWALNETAGSIFSVTKGLIKAASSDDVQVLALIACEAFGSTLVVLCADEMAVKLFMERNTKDWEWRKEGEELAVGK